MTNSRDIYLQLDNVSKRYPGAGDPAVDGIRVAIARGEFLSLLGPSGSGKTTTLMMIAGFELPTGGSILLGGDDIVNLPAHRRNFGMVFQNYALFPHMSVFDNVAYPLRLRKRTSAEIRASVGRYLEMVGLGALADRRPAELSGGQQQRVALARALVFEPSLVLMDEPLGALDKNLREQLQIEIKELQKALGITLIYVTHDQSEAMTMSDRIAVFNHGRIEQVASPMEIYRRPASRFVGEFVGDSNMVAGIFAEGPRSRVESTLGNIACEEDAGFSPGEPVFAMIRPELIRLSGEPSSHNAARLTVTRTINFGDRVTVEATSDDGTPLRLRVSDREAARCLPGTKINVTWQADDVHILARNG